MHLAVFKNDERNGPYIFVLHNPFFFFFFFAWCTGKTQRDRVEREVRGGIRMHLVIYFKSDKYEKSSSRNL